MSSGSLTIAIRPLAAQIPSQQTARRYHLLEVRMRRENGRVVETAVEARAGFLDRPVLMVLVIATLSVVVIFALVLTAFFAR